MAGKSSAACYSVLCASFWGMNFIVSASVASLSIGRGLVVVRCVCADLDASSLVMWSSVLVGVGEVLGYVAAVMAVHVVDLGSVDHRQRLHHELLEPSTGHRLVVHEAQLDEVALRGGPDVLD